MVEGDSYQQLLTQLADRNQVIDPELLLCPNPRVRPGIGLVASYDKVRQRMLLPVADGMIWGSSIAVVSLGIGALDSLGWIAPLKRVLAEWDVITPWLVDMAMGAVALVALLLFAIYLMGKISWRKSPLDLDLNGIYHESPQGRHYTPWAKVVNRRPVRKERIKLFLDDGGILSFRVPQMDCDRLAKVIESLILRHQPEELLGKVVVRAPQTDSAK